MALDGRVFLWGPLAHPPLLAAVAGHTVSVIPARLAGHALVLASGGAAALTARAGAEAAGVLAGPLGPQEADRLAFHEAGFGRSPQPVTVETAAGPVGATAFLPAALAPAGAPWPAAAWAARWGPAAVLAAEEAMALRGSRPAAEIFARHGQRLVRAASRLRAGKTAPATLRRRAGDGDVAVEDWRQPYARYFALEEWRLRFRRFDGTLSEPVDREVFVSGDAATVLPYDPLRDRVLVIEQFRAGPWARGDAQPWLLEPIAGRIDAGESPEEAIRREALEEAGVVLGELIPAGRYYPSPAAKAEYLFSFIGLAELPDGWRAGASGLADEHEDIRTHVIPFERLMALVETGEAENGPLLLTALFLARHRDRLRGAA
jgi:nudix-type nucleoside diphosphatase (YffH/AdpP family)